MRFMPMLSVALLVSCADTQANQVSNSYPEMQPQGLSLPAMQSFAPQALAPIGHSNAELAQFVRSVTTPK